MGDQSFFYLLLKTAIALSVVILFIFAVFFILKKIGYKSLLASDGKNNRIQILEKKFLAPKQYLVHIEWEGHKLLLGIFQNQLTVIKEIKNSSASTKPSNNSLSTTSP